MASQGSSETPYWSVQVDDPVQVAALNARQAALYKKHATLAEDKLSDLWTQLVAFMDEVFNEADPNSHSSTPLTYVKYMELHTLQVNLFQNAPGKNPITMRKFYGNLETYFSYKADEILRNGRDNTQIRVDLISRVLSYYQRNLHYLDDMKPTIVIRGDDPDATEKLRALENQPEEPKKTVAEMWRDSLQEAQEKIRMREPKLEAEHDV